MKPGSQAVTSDLGALAKHRRYPMSSQSTVVQSQQNVKPATVPTPRIVLRPRPKPPKPHVIPPHEPVSAWGDFDGR